MPTDIQAADYSATMTYLKAVQAAKSGRRRHGDGADQEDAHRRLLRQGRGARDGRFVHDMYLMQVKSPAESKQPWDYYKVVQKLKGEDVYTTKAESKCALWK
jgi:branched-chain amino acid transport system substrate-binding protein